jgi:hypothetical protein
MTDNIFEDELPGTSDEIKILLESMMLEFKANFHPGTADDHDHDKGMTTEDVFNIFDNHVPDILTLREMAALLHKNGYISRYDTIAQEFKWLIK